MTLPKIQPPIPLGSSSASPRLRVKPCLLLGEAARQQKRLTRRRGDAENGHEKHKKSKLVSPYEIPRLSSDQRCWFLCFLWPFDHEKVICVYLSTPTESSE